MKRLLALGFCLLLACKPENDAERPSWLLPEDKMVMVQADVHTLESRIQMQRLEYNKSKPLFDRELVNLCKDRGTDTSLYRRSFYWYATRPNLMDDIYQRVVDTLNVRESRKRKR